MTKEEFLRRYTFTLREGIRVLNNAFMRAYNVPGEVMDTMTIDEAFELAQSKE